MLAGDLKEAPMSAPEVESLLPAVDLDATSPAGSVLAALYALQDAEALFRCRMRDFLGVGANEFGALDYVARLGDAGREVRPRDITRTLGITRAATTILLNRLEQRGFLTRNQDPHDGRGQLVELTTMTRGRLAEAYGNSQIGVRDRLSKVTSREAKRIVVLLGAVTASLESAAPLTDGSPSLAS
jgi:DNA-binding MarR family transcriptional regulator